MNRDEKYNHLMMNWTLDDWSIPRECFQHIANILPWKSTILELGGGHTSSIFSQFYNVYTVEQDGEWVDFVSNPTCFHVPVKEIETIHFGAQLWYDVDILKEKLHNISYDLLLVDGPKGMRGGFLNNLKLFNNTVPWIFDDTMESVQEYQVYKLCKKITGRDGETFQCSPNPRAAHWFEGKRYSILYPGERVDAHKRRFPYYV